MSVYKVSIEVEHAELLRELGHGKISLGLFVLCQVYSGALPVGVVTVAKKRRCTCTSAPKRKVGV